jgi:predicted neuraminidase
MGAVRGRNRYTRPGMSSRRVGWPWLALVAAICLGAAVYRVGSLPVWAPPFAFSSDSTPRDLETDGPTYEVQRVSSGRTPSVHSATCVELSDGRLRAFWYGGSREGAKDVSIYSSVFDPQEDRWSEESVVAGREDTAKDLGRYIRKLGNPVAGLDSRGRLWLFYVSVSLGGWSGSSVNFKISEDDGRSFGRTERLVTSPFINISTLVRGPFFLYADGTLGLPVYHEFLGKFSELLRLDAMGRVLAKTRLSWGRSSLQPVVVPTSPLDAVALLRRSGTSPARILTAFTRDGGRHWSRPEPSDLPNPDAAVSAIRARDGSLLLVFNDSQENRGSLSLALSNDAGRSWRIVHRFETPPSLPSGQNPRFAYPWLLQTRDGSFHLLYTWDRARIVHVHFDREWLRSVSP